MFESLTDAELHELNARASRATSRLYDTAAAMYGKASGYPALSDQAGALRDRAKALMLAGHEQMNIAGEARDEIYRRAEAHAARVTA